MLPESLLVQGVLWDDKILGSEAILLFGRREVVTVLGILEVLRVTLVLVPFRGVVVLFGGVVAKLPHVIRSVIISGAVHVCVIFLALSSPSGSHSSAFGRFLGRAITVLLGRVTILLGVSTM